MSELSRIEHGKRCPPLVKLEKIAAALGVEVVQLVSRDPVKGLVTSGSEARRAAIKVLDYKLRERSAADVEDVIAMVELMFKSRRKQARRKGAR